MTLFLPRLRHHIDHVRLARLHRAHAAPERRLKLRWIFDRTLARHAVRRAPPYPTRLRGTGEGFAAANIGGRFLGTFAALVTTTLASYAPGATPPIKLAYAAGLVGTTVYIIGFIASFWLPEPRGEELPE